MGLGPPISRNAHIHDADLLEALSMALRLQETADLLGIALGGTSGLGS